MLVDAGITPGTIAFVLIIAAGVSSPWLTMRWTVLAIAGGVLSGAYVLALIIAAAVIDRDETGLGWNDFWQSVLGAGLFWALLAGVALAHHRLRGEMDRGDLARTLQPTVGAGALAVLGASAMFVDAGAEWVLLVLAAAYAALTLALGTTALTWSSERLDWGTPIKATARPATLAAVAAILYAVATVIVDLGLLASFTRDSFRASHAVVSIVWGIGALVILVLGLRRGARLMRTAGLALLGVTLAKLLLFDLSQLDALSRAVAFVVVGALFVAGSIAYQRLSSEQEPGED